jgi:RimJ/RimL family protein N-acetyltransferase
MPDGPARLRPIEEADVENLAEQRVLERIGFRREGVLRGLAFIGGRWRHGLLYAQLRGDLTGSGD